ncbi:hypothetical protein FB567DRAFT_224928 [Paraphoma chrysanthemicola]|uniref:Uncharacterized protein n=1 Tax=Paraphoma chrysanthemicola TaxID=798071 RepID=A0A8K0VS41_9PLEO|nr:hypothetical protein FB567DRAFT_224928 [Paraphoma chrysanthemicola]
MPPYGLYKVPQHHRYGNAPPARRHVYNTMDFQDDKPQPKPSKAVIDEAARSMNGMADEEHKKKDKKKKKKKSLDATAENEINGLPGPATAPASASTLHLSGDDRKKSKKKKDKEAHSADEPGQKRKRLSEADAQPYPSGEAETGDHASSIEVVQPESKTAPTKVTEISSKKKKDKGAHGVHGSSKKRKRLSEADAQPHPSDEAGIGDSGSGIEAVQPESETAPAKVTENSSKKRKKDKRRDSGPAKPTTTAALNVSDKVIKDQAGNQRESLSTEPVSSQSKAPTATESPYITTPKQTPIPVPPPQKSTLRVSSTTDSPQHPHTPRGGGVSEILVRETPTSQMPQQASAEWKTPIPFSLAAALGTNTGSKPSKFDETRQQPSDSVSAAQSITAKEGLEHEAPALTTANLRRTQPLSNKSRPRPSGRAASVSSISSMSIKDAFARISKPSSSPFPDYDPFFAPRSEGKTKKRGAQKEASSHTVDFASVASAASQAKVDFTTELDYLHAHLRSKGMNDAAGPLPCLKNATGCSSKSEQALQLLREDDTNTVKLTICSDAEQNAFDHSVAAALEAERFLRNAIMAVIPVPLGKLEGVYSLYCPKYSSAHVDKYGYGQRILSIQRPSGFRAVNHTYTARLSLAPRPMAYSVLAFSAPLHASFRSTTLTTSEEGYALGLTCLGNGYVMLTMDLGLLLTGRKSERAGKEGSVCMEFLGVKEKGSDGAGAVKWNVAEEKVKKEIQATRASEKELGGNGTQAGADMTPKKKRGRPTNVERERRAQEAASSQLSSQR